jgi:hypothetical protein
MIKPSIQRLLRQGDWWENRFISPSMAAGIGILLITCFALFIPPFIGMADNGDFFRVASTNGLYFLSPDYDAQYFGYFVKEFGILQYVNENQSTFFTSQSLLIQIAVAINKWLISPEVFDIRVLAAGLTLMHAAAVYLLVEGLTWGLPRKTGYFIAALAVLIFGDTGYTAYFNSLYGEGLVLVTTVMAFASWLLLYRRRYNDSFMLFLFLGSVLLLTTSKQQNAPVGLILALMGIAIYFIRKERSFRALTAVSLAIMLVSGIATYLFIPKEFANINRYHAMTRGVLMEAIDPEESLRSLGIDEQFALLKNTLYYDQFGAVELESPEMEKKFYSKATPGAILKYYATHPDRFSALLNLAAKNAFTIKPPLQGNYEKAAGKPFKAQSHFFTAYSQLKDIFMPKTLGFIVIWILVITGMYLPSFIAAVKAREFRHAQRLVLVLAMMGVGLSGILVSIVGAGDADLAKHEFLFTLTFDLITLLFVADCMGNRLFIFRKPQQQAPSVAVRQPAQGGVPMS